MNRLPSKLLFLAALSFCVSEAMAQDEDVRVTRSAKLHSLSESLLVRDANDRRQSENFARKAGIPMRRELAGGRVLELQRIAPGIGPVFYVTYNVDAADTVSTDEVWPGGSAGLDLDGGGMTIGEWDGGAVFSGHPDLAGRLTQVDGATVVSNHSTHVAGTLVGSGQGLVAAARGMAYAAQLNAWDWNSDTAEMAAAAAGGLLFSNHSYGIAAGWLYIGDLPPDTWWWIGGAADTDVEDPNFGYYDTETQLWDQIAFDAPFYLIVKAASNDRSDIGPAPGEQYTVIDQDGEFLFYSTLPRNPDCAPAGYDCLPTTSGAKNVLTVGAVDDLIGGYSPFSGPASVQMADFSGWGPTDDGRLKPDLVANGIFLMSLWGDSPYYVPAAGTSMAAPNATGSLALLQEHYQDLHGAGNFMRAATLKALAIHTADEAGDEDGPDYEFGWGLLNTKTAAKVISEDGGDHQIIEDSLADGQENTVEITVAEADSILTATLVWSDPPATPVAPALDPPDLMLVNDLDLRIESGPDTFMPWVLNPAAPAVAATQGDNFRDNVEQVVISAAAPGSYFIKVSHKAGLLNGQSQAYSLIISVDPSPPEGSGFLIDEDFSGGIPAGWLVDTVIGKDWTVNTPDPGHNRLDNRTGGAGKFAIINNGWLTNTYTSLVTPSFDMTHYDAVILRYKSFFIFDELESINVEISTDGGAGWTNVWIFQGFNPFPTNYVLDLSPWAAGQGSVTVRFLYNTYGVAQGDLWQIDDVELEVFGGAPPPGDPPGPASSPSPADGATDVGTGASLSWSAGVDTDSHYVYFGTDPSPDESEFVSEQAGTAYDPGVLLNSTTYYWRIDEVNDQGTTVGPVWSFTTEAAPVPPGQASTPTPGDGATDVDIDADMSWIAGANADSHDVYLDGVFQANTTATTHDPGTLLEGTSYSWRVDAVNAAGTTSGATWSFTTTPAPVQQEFRIAGITVDTVHVRGPRYKGVASVTVTNDAGAPVSGVELSGTFSGDWAGTRSGISDGSGQVAVETPPVKNGQSFDFCVDTASKPDWDFDQANSVGLCGGPPPPPPTTGAVNGTVTDSGTGLPIAGAVASADTGQNDTTDAAGSYSLNDVPTGNRTITVNAAGYQSANQQATVSDGLTTTLDFALAPDAGGGGTGTLKGTVKSTTGAKLAGALVEAGGLSTTTNKGGKYTLQNVPEGNQDVTASSAGYASSTTAVTISADQTVNVNFNLVPN